MKKILNLKRKTRIKSSIRIYNTKNKSIIDEIEIDDDKYEEIGLTLLNYLNHKQFKFYLVFNDGSRLRIKTHYTKPLDIFKRLKISKRKSNI